jgi:bacillithiol biosynthesis deacetylase BshB1
VALHAARGARVGLCDVTRGELGSNGTPDERAAEAEAAREVLGAAWRRNLGWPDGKITGSDEQIAGAVRLIRECRPQTIALPFWNDRHPDHRAASDVLTRAVFKSALRRFDEASLPAWRADWVCYYFINDADTPSFAIDISAQYEIKRKALACHQSQFTPADAGSVPTRLTSPRFLQLVESRDAYLGAQTGVAFAEGLIVREPLLRPHIFKEWAAFASDRAAVRGGTSTK